jgi:transcriptional regulator with XRE-family HTH domain
MLLCINEMDPQASIKDPLEALPDAIRDAYKGRARQEDVALAAGVDQATISRYVRGLAIPNVEVMRKIEDRALRPRGWISVQAGYVTEPLSVPEAIAMDPALTDELRASLLAGYWAAVESNRPAGNAGDDAQISGE